MDDLSLLAERVPLYLYECNVLHVVDGDTFDVAIDLGFEIRTTERVRLRGIDTAEIHGRSKDSDEYQMGQQHKHAVTDWIAETDKHVDDYAFVLYSESYKRGGFGRIIADVWSRYHEQWLSDYLRQNFENIEYY